MAMLWKYVCVCVCARARACGENALKRIVLVYGAFPSLTLLCVARCCPTRPPDTSPLAQATVERWAFLGKHYDANAAMNREYTLTYYPKTNELEMVGRAGF